MMASTADSTIERKRSSLLRSASSISTRRLRSCRIPVNAGLPSISMRPTERWSGKVLPSFRRPRTSRPVPMILGNPGFQVIRDVAVVLLPIGAGHQHLDVLIQDVFGAIAEQPLGGRVERLE